MNGLMKVTVNETITLALYGCGRGKPSPASDGLQHREGIIGETTMLNTMHNIEENYLLTELTPEEIAEISGGGWFGRIVGGVVGGVVGAATGVSAGGPLGIPSGIAGAVVGAAAGAYFGDKFEESL
jgi:hypothetical protein